MHMKQVELGTRNPGSPDFQASLKKTSKKCNISQRDSRVRSLSAKGRRNRESFQDLHICPREVYVGARRERNLIGSRILEETSRCRVCGDGNILMEQESLRQKAMDGMEEGDFCSKREEFWRRWTDVRLSAGDHHKKVLEFFSHQNSYLLKLERMIRQQAAERERDRIKLNSAVRALGLLLQREERHQEAMKSACQALEAEKERNVCQICLENPRSVLIMPCMHLLYCVKCIRIYLRKSTSCPMCRGTIKSCIPCTYNLDRTVVTLGEK